MIIADFVNGQRVEKATELQQLTDELSMVLTALEQSITLYDILQRCQPYIRSCREKKALDSKRHQSELRGIYQACRVRGSRSCTQGVSPAKSRDDVKRCVLQHNSSLLRPVRIVIAQMSLSH